MTKRMEVTKADAYLSSYLVLKLKTSDVGKRVCKPHKYSRTIVRVFNDTDVSLIEVGDLFRCDGLPYTYRSNTPPKGYKWVKISTNENFFSLREIK